MKKAIKYVGIFFGVMFAIAVAISCSETNSSNAAINKPSTTTNSDSSTVASVDTSGTADQIAATQKELNWYYSDDEDKMDNSKRYFAECTSTNTLDFDFPYNGGSTMTITVRNMDHKNEVVLSVSKGQFMSGLSDDEVVRFKFDDEKPVEVGFSSAADGSSNYIFPESSSLIIRKIKSAKHVIVEAPFYQAGRKQAEFDVEGLDWKY